MHIACIDIRNFRKLKSCRIEIAEQETILVGANNSGKTSAIDALTLFLKKSHSRFIKTTDFTLTNWKCLDQIGKGWVQNDEDSKVDINIDEWIPHLPSVDVWLKVEEQDLHRVAHLLPTLDWNPDELLGVTFLCGPKNLEELYKDFRSVYMSARSSESSVDTQESQLKLWPKSMRDYLDIQLNTQFEIQSYILDPLSNQSLQMETFPPPMQTLDSCRVTKDPFRGLIKIDVIPAQRGFSDPNTDDESQSSFASLSTQLRRYFSKHLNPTDAPDASDVEALEAIEAAKTVFNEKLMSSFKPAIEELEGLNYPGFSDPKVSITSKIDPKDTLDHDAVVQFDLPGDNSLFLPEKYNGLGYQNLISMVFNLIRFRDEWMRIGKAGKNRAVLDNPYELLHLVLIEEPEAHLHPQVQQVFVKKAYTVLCNYSASTMTSLCTQIVVSTHSSHIAHELDFSSLRYFRREPVKKSGEIPTATVVNLSKTFGNPDATSKFATRYLRTTHCELFFADAAILVEGSTERMLLPAFIRSRFAELDKSYIVLLEIGGAHAHRLKPLLEILGLPTLIVTDLDSIPETNNSKIRPVRGKRYRTGNSTLKNWVPKVELLDDLFDLQVDKKQTTKTPVRVAYPCPVIVDYKRNGSEDEVVPYTFEDSLVFSNISRFREYEYPKGLLKKLQTALEKETLQDVCVEMFENLKTGDKAEMALELLYMGDPDQLEPPEYVAEGLEWLQQSIENRKVDSGSMEVNKVNDA